MESGWWVYVLTLLCKLFLFEYLCNKNINEGKMRLGLGCREIKARFPAALRTSMKPCQQTFDIVIICLGRELEDTRYTSITN